MIVVPPLNMLIKPSSGNCNLRCKYCFYNSLTEKRKEKDFGFMSEDILEILVKKAFDYADVVCTFGFQGGEPTLVGLEFYKKLLEFQKKYNKNNIQVNNCIQTNGIIIDDKWAKFLVDNNFLVGISLDGPKDIHDANRVDANNKGSYSRVIKTINLFNKYKVEYNILFVVNGYSARHASKLYNYFINSGYKYIQFIPCLDPLDEEPGKYPYSLTPKKYAQFLKSLFDCWYNDILKGEYISIRTFDNYINMVRGNRSELCGMMGVCSCQFIVEANGSVYPCDFYVTDEWYLGNIKEKSLEEIRDNIKTKEFINVSMQIDDECNKCKFLNICRGGCRRNREPFKEGHPKLNYYCESYKDFFEHALPRIIEISKNYS